MFLVTLLPLSGHLWSDKVMLQAIKPVLMTTAKRSCDYGLVAGFPGMEMGAEEEFELPTHGL